MKRALTFLTCVLLGTATPASAQYATKAPGNHSTREGFWIGFGFGSGHLAYHADASSVDPLNGFSGHFRLGGTLNQQWRLGAETNGWVKSEQGTDLRFGTLMGTATFYPRPDGNFFLKAGIGAGSYTENDGTNDLIASGGAGQFGLGYDFRFSGNVGMTAYGNYIFTNGWGVDLNSSSTGLNADPSLLQIGIGVVWH